MSDDKSKDKTGNASGADGGTPPADAAGAPTPIGFGELWGQIDSRIEGAVRKVMGKGSEGAASSSSAGTEADPQSVAAQVRAELAKLSGEEAAAKKDSDRDVTIQELKDQMSKITEAAPVEKVSRLTEIMWGKRNKS